MVSTHLSLSILQVELKIPRIIYILGSIGSS